MQARAILSMHLAPKPKASEHPHGLSTVESTGGRSFVIQSFDGVPLRCACWPAIRPPESGTILYLQGRTEFIEKNLETIGDLRRRGFAVWTLDWRGQGLSGRLLDDPHKGHVANYEDYLLDLQLLFGGHMKNQATSPFILLGHSMGAHIGLRFLHDHPDTFERAVLCSPMIDIRSGLVGFCARLMATVAAAFGAAHRYVPGTGPYDANSRRFEGNTLTADPERFARTHAYIAADPRLALGGPTLGWLAASFRSIAQLRRDAKAIRKPVLIVSAGDERVVDNAAQHRLVQRDLANGRLVTIAGARHEVLCERDDIRDIFWRHFDDVTGHRASA